jgi:hypothetical protein
LSRADANDALWLLSSELLANNYAVNECFEVLPVDGAVRCMVEEKVNDLRPLVYDDLKPVASSYVLLQILRPRQFTVLTTSEVVVVDACRPLDQLEYLLNTQATNIENSLVLKSFFDLIRPDQACVLALSLACSSGKHGRGAALAEKAARAVLYYGCANVPGVKVRTYLNYSIGRTNRFKGHFSISPELLTGKNEFQ